MIRFFTAHPTAANLLMIGIIGLGLAAATTVKRETFPDVPLKEVQVSVLYPAATAEEVEEGICRRIEDAVDNVNSVDEIRCEARENRGTATIKIVQGDNFDRFFTEIRTEVEAIDNFPDQAEDPIIRQLGLTDFVGALAIGGPMAATDLKAYADNIKQRMLRLDDITQVKVTGFSDRQLRIEIPATTLRQYGISVDDIARTVGQQSVDLPAGTLETTETDVLIRFNDERRNPLEFQDLVVVGAASGAEIRLGDIAKITDRFELAEDKIIFNGQRAAVLEITKTKSQDTLTVIGAVRKFIEDERLVAPPGVQFEITRDFASVVKDRLTTVTKNGAYGLLLVFLTLLLFFNFRFSFWVAAAFPVSFAGTIFVMALAGLSFDLITLVGLLIGIGLLVDDAIVISENIAAHHRRGSPPLQAAIEGTQQVAPGVIASFLTTICVFGSLAFLKGDIGSILKWMPIILILTLTVSLVEAFFILPHHMYKSLSHHSADKTPWLRGKLDAGIGWLRDVLLRIVVDWSLRWRYLAVGSILAVFLASLSMVAGGHLKFRAFPDVEGNVVEARLLMPQGTPLARTSAVVEELVAAAGQINREQSPQQPEGRQLIKNVNVQFNRNVDAFETGPHVATVTIDLLSTEIRTTAVDDLIARWRELSGTPADVIGLKFTEPQLGPAGRAIDIRLQGEDLARLKEAALDLHQWLRRYDGVNDLTDDLRPGKPELLVRLRDGATALGINAQTIAIQLRTAFNGRTASEIQVGRESYEVDVRLADYDRNSLGDLEYFAVTGTDGAQVPLGAVASLGTGRGFARIHRIDRLRTVTLQGDVDTRRGNVQEILGDTEARFFPEFRKKYPEIFIDFSGEAKEGARTGKSVGRGFLIGLVGVFLLLSFLFRSYAEPIIVMMAIPLGLIGVIWGHLLLGLDLSMPSIIGFASLAGVVVNNAILMVEFIKIRRRAGDSVADAARNASQMRFRAILLTSATTIMGLLPLITEKSLQAQILIPLVTSIAFGLLVSTFLILVMVPALYAILDDFGVTAKLEDEDAAALPAPAE